MSVQKILIDRLIDIEGGYVNDPSDSGGATKFGITKKVARQYGYKGTMRSLPRKVAFKIYVSKYWNPLLLDDVEKICPIIVEELFDTGVNMGVGRSGRFLQRSLNVLNDRQRKYADISVDGQIGKNTLKALRLYSKQRRKNGGKVLFRMLNSLQGAFYVRLSERRQKDERFIYGWFLNRVK